MQRLPFPLKLWPIPQSQYLSFSAALLDATQHAGVTQESIIKDDPAFILNVCCPCFPLQSVRAPSATLHQRTPRATTTSPSTATSRDTTTCRPSAAPPPPGEHLSDCQSEFPPPDFGDEFRPVLAKRKSKLSALLWQSEQQWGSCHTEEPLFRVDPPPPPLFDSTPPLCGPKWYSLHRDRLVIQTGCGEEGWTVATPAVLQLRSPPMGKTLPKIFTVKSSHMGMFMCLNSSERAPIEIFHIFRLLPISCLNFLSLLSEFKIF